MKRKPPIRHKVRSHTRQGEQVQSYQRGKGQRIQKARVVVGENPSSIRLKEEELSSAVSKDMLSDKVERIMKKAASKAVPIIYEECDRLGIKTPKIEWVKLIRMNGEVPSGKYAYETQTILLAAWMIKILLEANIPEPNIVNPAILHMYFHEFKHYVDDEYYKITLEEYERNRNKYEADATKYAEELIKRVK